MKTSIVRLSVFALVVTGFAASSLSAAAAKNSGKTVSAVGIVNTPTPMCPWNDPKGCGIDPDVKKTSN